jgi:LysR family hydrogen peroxide-inducible transcriptional activator
MYYLRDHLEKLHSFLVIAEQGSFRKASAALGTTQPALSRQIATLEDILRSQLFERSHLGIRLTETGRILQEFGRKLLRDVEAVELRIRQPAGEMVGNLHIGTFESLSIRIWPKMVSSLRTKFPDLRLGVTTGDTSELYEKVLSGELDLAVTEILEPDAHPRIYQVPIFEDSYGFYCAPTFPLKAEKSPLATEEAMKLPIAIVRSPRCAIGGTMFNFLIEKGLRFEQVYEVSTFEAAANYACEAVGLALLPGVIAAPFMHEGRLRPVRIHPFPSNAFCKHRIGMIGKSERRGDPLLGVLEEHLRADSLLVGESRA